MVVDFNYTKGFDALTSELTFISSVQPISSSSKETKAVSFSQHLLYSTIYLASRFLYPTIS